MPWLKSFPLPGSVILSAHFPSCFASNEIDSFANELSMRQIEKKPSCKA